MIHLFIVDLVIIIRNLKINMKNVNCDELDEFYTILS